jgi:hypothetical protein
VKRTSAREGARRRKRGSAIAQRRLPFSPAHEARDESYDGTADFSRSLDDCYRAVRARVAGGGKGWEPR